MTSSDTAIQAEDKHKSTVAEYFSGATMPWESMYYTPDDVIRSFSNYAVTKRKDIVLELLDAFAVNCSLSVLDAGCGTGIVLGEVLRHGHRITGVDISDKMVAKANERLSPALPEPPCRQADIENLPFEDGSFDAVLSMGVIMYLPDDHAALRELNRVLKPGGRLFLVVPNLIRLNMLFDPYYICRGVRYLQNKWQRYRGTYNDDLVPHDFKTNRNFTNRRYTRAGLMKLLLQHGFADPRFTGVEYSPPTFWGRELLSLDYSISFSEKTARLAGKNGFGWLERLTGQWVISAVKF